MTERRIRVLIVDDSAFARKVLREILSRAPDIDVVGTATDGIDALEKASLLKPDVLTLDLVMPNLDGLGFLKALPETPTPRVVIVSKSDGQSESVLAALDAGAIDVVQKPTALATDQLYELGAELIAKVRMAADAVPRLSAVKPAERAVAALPPSATRLVVIGASTGGPQALTRVLSGLPADFRPPVAIVLHIPVGYTQALAERLDSICALDVREAADGMEFRSGLVMVARAGVHLRVRAEGDRFFAQFTDRPTTTPHRPAVDVLFESAAEAAGAGVLGVVLTGMGDDGLAGATKIHAAGGVLLTESRLSCVVYGMPRVVQEAGLAREQHAVDQMASALVRLS